MEASRWTDIIKSPEGTLAAEAIAGSGSFFPPEAPFFILEAILAGSLLASGTRLNVPGGTVLPDMKIAVLAASGAGKTLALQKINGMLGGVLAPGRGLEFCLYGCQSAAALFDLLYRKAGSLAVLDPFAGFYSGLSHHSGGRRMRELLLSVFRREDVVWTTKKAGARAAERPALCILALEVPQSLVRVYADDGGFFGEHFLYVLAPWHFEPDPAVMHADHGGRRAEWTELVQSAAGKEYVPSSESLAVHEDACGRLFAGMPEPERLRHAEEMHRHALLRHVMCGRGGIPEIGAGSYRWAASAMQAHLADERRLGLDGLRKKRRVRP